MDSARLFSRLIHINGLDLWEGLSHAGNRESYAKTLRVFCIEVDKKLRSAGELLAGENWQDYRIAVHGIKGALASIGAWELARKSLELEDACRNKNYEFCQDYSAGIMTNTADFVASLKVAVFFEEEAGPKEPIAAAILKEKLRELERACASGDSSTAETIIQELRTKAYDAKTAALIEMICSHVESLDYDIVLDGIQVIVEQ